MGTGTGLGTRRRTPGWEQGRERGRKRDSSGNGNGDDDNGKMIGLGRAEERRKSARKRKIVIDAVRETGETRVERETNVEKKGLIL